MIAKNLLLISLLLGVSLACTTVSRLFDKSGTLLVIEVKTDEPELKQVTDEAARILESRMNALGVNHDIAVASPNRIEVKIYGSPDIERAKRILVADSKFELAKVVSPPNPSPLAVYPSREAASASLGGRVPPNRKILPYADRDTEQNDEPGSWIIIETPPIVDGREVRDASAVSRSGIETDYQISFALKPTGAQKFGEWTGQNIGNYLAIVLNGEVKSAPFIKSQIFDSGEITGRFTKSSAEDLALVMRSGYLPATLRFLEEKPFGK